MAPPPPPTEVVAEYAKSGRASCKACAKPIAKGALRLGLSTKDPRGFDAVKWHHIDCFASQPHPLRSEAIKGFSSLNDCDQEALRKLEASAADTELSLGKATNAEKDSSLLVVEDKYKVTAEYAKSNRSSCKGCREVIVAGSLRLGLSSKVKDPREFVYVKWHHLACFPAGAIPFDSTKEIEGFSSLKNCDQEAIMKLETAGSADRFNQEGHTRDENTVIEKSDGRSLKKPKICNEDDVGNGESEDMNSEELKLSEPAKEKVLELDFSVSDIKDKYKDATLSPKWKAFKTIIFRERDDGLRDSEKIAAFDFDGCLANTSVKRIGPDAWSLLYPSIPKKLQELHNSGYKLVFVACGLGKGKDQTDDPYRKPEPGMWRIMERHFNSGIAVDMEQSFYVGDAAGRANDHSDADIKFAQAVGLKFYVPEEYFGAAKAT